MKLISPFLVGALCIFAGCAVPVLSPQAWQDETLELVWPAPPETPRIKLLRTLEDLQSLGPEERGGRFVSWITGGVSEELGVVSPYAVAADGEGLVWLTDGGLSGVHLFDLARRKVSFWPATPGRPFVFPLGIAFDRRLKRVYVSDAQTATILALTVKGEVVDAWDFPVELTRPIGLAVGGDGNLYVVDAGRDVVEVVSSDARHLMTLDSRGSVFGPMKRPTNVAVTSRDDVLVVDSYGFRVLVFSPEGEVKTEIGGLGDGPGRFARPRGIAVDSEDHVYVSDAAFDNIQIFDMAGNALLYFGGVGSAPGFFSLPAGLYMDSEDRLYAVDAQNRRVQVFQYLPLNVAN